MAKYELIKKTENNGEVWYSIRKDGYHVSNSTTLDLKTAELLLEEFEKGKPAEPIIEILKTIEAHD